MTCEGRWVAAAGRSLVGTAAAALMLLQQAAGAWLGTGAAGDSVHGLLGCSSGRKCGGRMHIWLMVGLLDMVQHWVRDIQHCRCGCKARLQQQRATSATCHNALLLSGSCNLHSMWVASGPWWPGRCRSVTTPTTIFNQETTGLLRPGLPFTKHPKQQLRCAHCNPIHGDVSGSDAQASHT